MRLFIAVPLPKEVKNVLIDLQEPIDGVRWQREQQMHLTLKFIGEANTQLTKSLQKRLSEIEYSTFTIRLKGLGYFPERSHPKVLWVGLRENLSLKELQQKVEEKCHEVGIAPESRPYKPHITLCRVQGASKRTINAFFNKHKKFEVEDIWVDQFVLYESKLHPDGARHRRVQTFSLNENK